jgi:hypothetical protein
MKIECALKWTWLGGDVASRVALLYPDEEHARGKVVITVE